MLDLKFTAVHEIIVKKKDDWLDEAGQQICAGFQNPGGFPPNGSDVGDECVGAWMDDQVKGVIGEAFEVCHIAPNCTYRQPFPSGDHLILLQLGR